MKSPAILLTLIALLAAASGGFAADRYQAVRTARAERKDFERQLQAAVKMATDHPQAFGPDAAPVRDSALKTLAQETATSRNVTIGYLSEGDREAEKGFRERQVHVRLVNAGHANLVLFLQDLESKGGGARIKELHIRPSRELPDTYEEAEAILSKVVPAGPEKKP